MPAEDYFRSFQTDGAGSGPQDGNMDGTPMDRSAAWSRYRQSQEMNRYAMLNNPLTAALTAMAGTATWGQNAPEYLRSDAGRAMQAFMGRLVGNGVLGAGNNPINLMYGAQQAAASGGFTYNFRDSAYGLGAKSNMPSYGGGFVSDMLAQKLTDGVFKNFYNAGGGQNIGKTYGMGMTDLGVMMNELQSRGTFAGMNAGQIETMSGKEWQSRFNSASDAGKKALREMATDQSGNRVSFIADANTQRQVTQYMEDSAKAIASMRNIFGSRGAQDLMRQAEQITGMSFSDPKGPNAIRNRIETLETMGASRGLSSRQMMNLQSSNTDAIMVGFGMDPMDPRGRQLAANLGMKVTEQSLSSFFQDRSTAASLARDKGIYLPTPLLNERNGMTATSLTRIAEETPELLATQLAIQNAEMYGIKDTSELRDARDSFAGAQSTQEVMNARGRMSAALLKHTKLTASGLIQMSGGKEHAMTMLSASAENSQQYADALAGANASRNYAVIKQSVDRMNLGQTLSEGSGMAVSNEDVTGTYWAMSRYLAKDEKERVAAAMQRGGSEQDIMEALRPDAAQRFADYKSGDRTGLSGAIASMVNMGKGASAYGFDVQGGFERFKATNPYLASDSSNKGNLGDLKKDQIAKLLDSKRLGEIPASAGGIVQNFLNGMAGTGEMGNAALLAWAKGHTPGGIAELGFNKEGGVDVAATERAKVLTMLSSYTGGSADNLFQQLGVKDEGGLWSKLGGSTGVSDLVGFLNSKGALWASGGEKGAPSSVHFSDASTKQTASDNMTAIANEATAAVLSGRAGDIKNIDEEGIKAALEKRSKMSKEEQDAENTRQVAAMQSNAYSLLKRVDSGDKDMSDFLSKSLESNPAWGVGVEAEISKRRKRASENNYDKWGSYWNTDTPTKAKDTAEADLMERNLKRLQHKTENAKKPFLEIELVLPGTLTGKLYNLSNQ